MTGRHRALVAAGALLLLAAAPALGGLGAPPPAEGPAVAAVEPWVLRAQALAAAPDAVEALALHAAWDRGDPSFVLAVPEVRGGTLVEEARGLFADLGLPPDPSVEGLATVPPPLAEGLAQVLRAYREAAWMTVEAFAEGPRPDLLKLAQAKALLARSALDALPALQPVDHPGVDACGALLLALNGADDEHVCEYVVALDLGGDDAWRNNAGGNRPGANLCATPGSASQGYPPTAAFALDAAGNDRYDGTVRDGGVAGGACNGLGVLVEAGGDDVYATLVERNGGANGGANFGAGLLLELAGDDRFEGRITDPRGEAAGSGGVNGGANFAGHGDLIDLGGADLRIGRVAREGGVNGGANDGSGFLFDCGPDNDAYDGFVAKGAGINGGSSLGRGLLLDCAGDDGYVGTIGEFGIAFGSSEPHGGINGGAAAFSAGLLLDLDGHDRYGGLVWGTGGVNGGAHDGAGGLVDLAGDDHYAGETKSHGGVNGAASRGGSGLLLDRKGHDRYRGLVGGTGGVNGAASAGLGLLVDGGGDDAYEGQVLGLRCDSLEELALCGGFANGGGLLGAGWLVDAGGADTYREGLLVESDNTLVKGSGGRIDAPEGSLPV